MKNVELKIVLKIAFKILGIYLSVYLFLTAQDLISCTMKTGNIESQTQEWLIFRRVFSFPDHSKFGDLSLFCMGQLEN